MLIWSASHVNITVHVCMFNLCVYMYLCVCVLGSAELNVAISRIPSQPAVLYSGNGVTLLCVITYNGSSSLQVAWYNGSQVLEGSGNVQLTSPYLVLGNVYVAASHISVLFAHTSWYYCNVSSNGSYIIKSLQVQVMDSGTAVQNGLCTLMYKTWLAASGLHTWTCRIYILLDVQ